MPVVIRIIIGVGALIATGVFGWRLREPEITQITDERDAAKAREQKAIEKAKTTQQEADQRVQNEVADKIARQNYARKLLDAYLLIDTNVWLNCAENPYLFDRLVANLKYGEQLTIERSVFSEINRLTESEEKTVKWQAREIKRYILKLTQDQKLRVEPRVQGAINERDYADNSVLEAINSYAGDKQVILISDDTTLCIYANQIWRHGVKTLTLREVTDKL